MLSLYHKVNYIFMFWAEARADFILPYHGLKAVVTEN
jgi:hypothetical protein